jgi:hypothetical protein
VDGTLSVLQLAVADRLDDLVLSESELGASSLVAQGGALAPPLGFEAVDDSPLPRNGLGNGAAGDDMVSDAHAVRVLNRGYRRACGRAWAVCEQQGRSGDVPDSELARRYRRIPFQITPSPEPQRLLSGRVEGSAGRGAAARSGSAGDSEGARGAAGRAGPFPAAP